MAGRAVAAVGVVLAFVSIWIDALPGASYWSGDGTTGAFCLVLACLAGLLLAAGYAGQKTNGALVSVGAVMLGYYGFIPAVLAFADWDQTRAGTWLAFAAGALILIGAGSSYVTAPASDTPAGLSPAALAAGLGIALAFPGAFLTAAAGASYWDAQHELGLLIVVIAGAAALVWAAGVAGRGTRGLDQVLTLVLLGLVAFVPIDAAFGNFGSLDEGAWLALAGGVLAAGGTWVARGTGMPRAAAAAA